jgi:hypothetical protein
MIGVRGIPGPIGNTGLLVRQLQAQARTIRPSARGAGRSDDEGDHDLGADRREDFRHVLSDIHRRRSV